MPVTSASWEIGWDIAHQEFTITDHYYFSRLLQFLESFSQVKVQEISEWQDLNQVDVVVLNYPEQPFSEQEKTDVFRWIQEGKRIILTGYYKDEDGVCRILNHLLEGECPLRISGDVLRDKVHCCCGDDLFLVSGNSRISGVHRVAFACPSSVEILQEYMPKDEKDDAVEFLLMSESTAFREYPDQKEPGPFGLLARWRSLFLVGTCVFWDNFSIGLLDNLALSAYLLLPDTLYQEWLPRFSSGEFLRT